MNSQYAVRLGCRIAWTYVKGVLSVLVFVCFGTYFFPAISSNEMLAAIIYSFGITAVIITQLDWLGFSFRSLLPHFRKAQVTTATTIWILLLVPFLIRLSWYRQLSLGVVSLIVLVVTIVLWFRSLSPLGIIWPFYAVWGCTYAPVRQWIKTAFRDDFFAGEVLVVGIIGLAVLAYRLMRREETDRTALPGFIAALGEFLARSDTMTPWQRRCFFWRLQIRMYSPYLVPIILVLLLITGVVILTRRDPWVILLIMHGALLFIPILALLFKDFGRPSFLHCIKGVPIHGHEILLPISRPRFIRQNMVFFALRHMKYWLISLPIPLIILGMTRYDFLLEVIVFWGFWASLIVSAILQLSIFCTASFFTSSRIRTIGLFLLLCLHIGLVGILVAYIAKSIVTHHYGAFALSSGGLIFLCGALMGLAYRRWYYMDWD